MGANQKGVSGANATTKASPFESEIHPSHKTKVLCSVYISPLQGAKSRKRDLQLLAHLITPDTAISS